MTSANDATHPGQSRICFVIMPFSTTQSCTEEEWTSIFQELLKPAVEEAELGYRCLRSQATRGNIVAQIMESLRDAYVVVADLTDLNPNVFYELGVRHALRDRTVLIAQDRKFIPFDLRPYANHVYDWKTDDGRSRLKLTIRDLLADIDASPDRSDNPVSDFLRGQVTSLPDLDAPQAAPSDASSAQSLAGPGSDGLDAGSLANEIVKGRDRSALRTVVRLTRAFFADTWPVRIDELNSDPAGNRQLTTNEIYDYSLGYLEKFSPDIERVEEFGLSLVEAEYVEGLGDFLRIVEDWISWSEQLRRGRTYKAVTGAPGLLAFRLLATLGAKAADVRSLDSLQRLLCSPLSTAEAGGQANSMPWIDRKDMFWPAAMLDYADLGVRYIREEPWKNSGLRRLFANQQDYLKGLSVFLFVASVIYEARNPDAAWPLYPGFKLIPGSSQAIANFVVTVSAEPVLLGKFAAMAGEEAAAFKENWEKRINRLNDASLGGRYDILFDWRRIPSAI